MGVIIFFDNILKPLNIQDSIWFIKLAFLWQLPLYRLRIQHYKNSCYVFIYLGFTSTTGLSSACMYTMHKWGTILLCGQVCKCLSCPEYGMFSWNDFDHQIVQKEWFWSVGCCDAMILIRRVSRWYAFDQKVVEIKWSWSDILIRYFDQQVVQWEWFW